MQNWVRVQGDHPQAGIKNFKKGARCLVLRERSGYCALYRMETVSCIVETPKGYGVKYDYDQKLASLALSKVLPAGLVFPFDFGFIPGTIGEDGDPLDVVIISEAETVPGCTVKCRIIGMIKAMQRERDGERMRNDRFIAVPEVSVMYAGIRSVDALPAEVISQLKNFFINYNSQAGKKFKPFSVSGPGAAAKAIAAARRDPQPTKLVQLLLPVYDNAGKPLPAHLFRAVNDKLLREFGGVTAYTQSPALGLWKDKGEAGTKVSRDAVVVYEVMASRVDIGFWKKYKKRLKKQFMQEEIVIRQTEIGLL